MTALPDAANAGESTDRRGVEALGAVEAPPHSALAIQEQLSNCALALPVLNMNSRILASAMCIAVSACAAPPAPPAYLASPADPARRGSPLRVGDVTAGTRNFRVAGPRDWMEINRDISPQQKEAPR